MNHTNGKSTTEIEHEIEQDRRRIEQRLGAIQEKLSPGQMIDEMLAYGKNHGGAEFMSNLKHSVTGNPLPVALVGVGLAWLMAKPANGHATSDHRMEDDDIYPLAPVTGEVRRYQAPTWEGTSRYSHFEDSAGKRYKALTDETGQRAGHFMDDAGQTFRGFMDSSGRQIDRIKDEAGNLLDEASGWAQKVWRMAGDAMGGTRSGLNSAGRSVSSSASSAFGSMQDQSARFNSMIQTAFRDQPLVGGALAFAFGAAIGAALPRTRTEDEMLGETATDIRKDISHQAKKAMDRGGEIASDIYDQAASAASDVKRAAADRINQETDRYTARPGPGDGSSLPH